uniref:Uncharacterized protein n=1 Tax=Cacopsylla melanoneura TaxID=428564 RepID=A0A8D9FF54_9HEMI
MSLYVFGEAVCNMWTAFSTTHCSCITIFIGGVRIMYNVFSSFCDSHAICNYNVCIIYSCCIILLFMSWVDSVCVVSNLCLAFCFCNKLNHLRLLFNFFKVIRFSLDHITIFAWRCFLYFERYLVHNTFDVLGFVGSFNDRSTFAS